MYLDDDFDYDEYRRKNKELDYLFEQYRISEEDQKRIIAIVSDFNRRCIVECHGSFYESLKPYIVSWGLENRRKARALIREFGENLDILFRGATNGDA